MIRALVIPLALFAASCATTAPPEAVVRTVRVEVPVPVPCAPAGIGDAPAYADENAALRNAPDAAERYRLLFIGRDQRAARLAELEAMREACGETATPAP